MSKTVSNNLGLIESTTDFVINIIYKKLNLLYLPEPDDFNTDANLPLLKKKDPDDETRGKVTYIPLDFLIKYFGVDKASVKPHSNSRLELKEVLCKRLEEEHPGASFFATSKFAGIPLYMYKKPYLNADLTKTVDRVSIISDSEEYNLINLTTPYKIFDPKKDIVRNRLEWLCTTDLSMVINSYIAGLPLNKSSLISYKGVMLVPSNSMNIDFMISQIKNGFDFKIEQGVRFVFFVILYRSHFTSVCIDLELITKDGRITRGAFFFNSTGFQENEFEYDPDYWFISNGMNMEKHKIHSKDYESSTNSQNQEGFAAIVKLLRNEYKITNFFFNTFSVQNLDSECGIFTLCFLLSFIDALDKKNVKKIRVITFKHIYHGMSRRGNDKVISCLRGMYFFTNDDISANKITAKDYKTNIRILPVTNNKFVTYKNMYEKAIKKIKIILEK